MQLTNCPTFRQSIQLNRLSYIQKGDASNILSYIQTVDATNILSYIHTVDATNRPLSEMTIESMDILEPVQMMTLFISTHCC